MQFPSRVATRSVILLLAVLSAPRESRAQLAESAHIAAGALVRVRTRDGAERAWPFERASAEELTLRRSCLLCRAEVSLPWSEVAGLDTLIVGGHQTRNVVVGSALGGFMSALVVAFGASAAPCNWDNGSCPALGFVLFAPAIIGTGMAIGGTVAYRRQRFWSTAWQAH